MSKFEITAYKHLPASYEPYDVRSAEVAQILARAIQDPDLRLRVDHIGSTSVPGLSGKGVIDLAVTYAEGDLETAKAALDRLGFQHQNGRDPWPEARPMRVAGIAALGAAFRVHAHVIVRDGEEHRQLLGFRNALREDAGLREAYENAKRAILRRGITDSLDYCDAKSEFIASSLAKVL